MQRRYLSNAGLVAAYWSLLSLLLFFSPVGAHHARADCISSGAGLIGWWAGDGNANNVFGTNNGTLQGGATATAPGLVGNAFTFDGTNGSVQIPNSALLRPTNLTIEAWVKFASMDSAGSGGSPAGDQYIVFRQNTLASNFEGFDLSKTRVGTTNLFRFRIASASGQVVELHSSSVISTGLWYHVAGIRGSNFVQLYVNGALERQASITFSQDYGNFPLYFATSGKATWDHKLNGSLDEVSFYNRPLASNEIAAIYAAGASGKCKGPIITSQPQSVTAFIGSNATFDVSATGFGGLTFQWRSNNVAINGATGTSLTLSNIQPAFSADYTVVVTNLLGSATSIVATLTVIPQPSAIVNVDFGDGGFGPKTGPAAIGQDANDFWTDAGAGTWPNLKTARGNTTLTTVNVPYGNNNWLLPWAASGDPMVDDYLYWPGSISPVTISQLPSGTYDIYLYSHDAIVQLSVGSQSYGSKTAFEGFPLSHPPQWQDGRQYVAFRNVAVTNGGSPVSIAVARGLQPDAILSGLQIACNGPWILQPPTGTVVAVTSNFVLHVSAEATPAPTYQWFLNGNALTDGGRISGAASNTLGISNAQLGDAGNYFAVAINTGGASTSLVAAVQVGFPPVFTQSSSNQTNLTGTTAQFTATVSGDQPIGLQWWFNGNVISDDARHSGSTTTNLTISGIVESDAGNYTMVASNIFGVGTSAVATLTVHVPATIVSQPSDQYVLANASAAFTVGAKGDQPLSFTWFFGSTQISDGGRISGSSTSALMIQNVQSNDLGDYSVVISNAWGVVTSAVATLNFATIRYVNVANGSPSPPYLTWATAATVIQDAINAAGPGDHIVVTNGSYSSGGSTVNGSTLVNRAAVNKPLILESVNGPAVTIIQGVAGPAGSAVRSVYLTNGTVLNGFTVKSGGTRNTGSFFLEQIGGGIFCESLDARITNCIITGNHSYGNAAGVFRGTLYNCTLNGNSAGPTDGEGGGAESSILYNCMLTGNSATWGGGAYYCSLSNCIVSGNTAQDPGGAAKGAGGGAYSSSLTNCSILNNSSRVYGGGVAWGTLVGCVVARNSADNGGGAAAVLMINCTVVGNNAVFRGGTGSGYGGGISDGTVINSILVNNTTGFIGPNYFSGSFSHSCASPVPGGDGNFDSDPLFLDFAGGNYHLQASSPCINAGANDNVSTSRDLDGQPRIGDGIVDLGAYEYQHAPFILTQPVSQSVLIFNNTLFSVSAIGDAPLSYTWQKNGTNLPADARITSTDTSTLSISNILITDAGGYSVVVTNASGSVTSSVATLTPLGLPIISVQPVSRTVPAGTNTTFSVTASGLAALAYQWRFNQTELPGKNNTTLSLTNVQSANAGGYDVVITNYYGAVTSSVATLTVLPAAAIITTQAVSRVASVGQTVSFTVAAKGSEPMSCQWQFNGSDLPGATGFALTLQNVNSSRTGTYRAAVTNAAGFTFSTNVTLVVSPILIWGLTNNQQLLAVASIPASATNVVAITAGGGVDNGLPCIALRADGSIVTWGYNSRDLPPPTNAVDVVAMSVGSSGGIANSLVLRADGSVVGWNGTTKPPSPPPGSNANFVAVAAGGSHQMALRDDGTVIAWGGNTFGVTNVPSNATNVIAIAAGTTHCLALRMDGSVVGWGLDTSGQATALSNAANVFAIAANGNQSMGLRGDGTVVGRIVSNGPPTAIFYGAPPSDATNMIAIAAGSFHSLALRSARTVTGWGQTNFGQLNAPPYATNVLAIATGGSDSLALVPDPFAPPILPRIARPPLGRTFQVGQSAVMNALAIGGLPLRYQWYRNGELLTGRTNQWLPFTNCQPGDAGNYQFIAMNEFGSATSTVAVVTVAIPRPALTAPVKNSTTVSFTLATVSGVFYVSEFRDELTSGNWTEFDRRLGTGASEVVTDTNALSQTRFFRVQAIYPPPP